MKTTTSTLTDLIFARAKARADDLVTLANANRDAIAALAADLSAAFGAELAADFAAECAKEAECAKTSAKARDRKAALAKAKAKR